MSNSNNFNWVVFIGPPGCGKGSQSENLISNFSFESICVGDILRNRQDKIISEEKTIGDLLNKGVLLPDNVIIDLVQDEINDKKYLLDKQLLFDGFPRTIGQAKALAELASKFDRKIFRVLNFVIEDEILLKRILGRFKCSSCGKIYNEFFLKPSIDNICDICGKSEFERRLDDTEESLKKRLSEYREKTQHLVDFYSESGILYNIEADASFEKVSNSVLDNLNLNRKKGE